MKATELTVDVHAKLAVPDKTIDRCLRLLEMWQEDNPDKYIEVKEILTDTGRKTIFQICVRETTRHQEEDFKCKSGERKDYD